jgi:hypothetical protein
MNPRTTPGAPSVRGPLKPIIQESGRKDKPESHPSRPTHAPSGPSTPQFGPFATKPLILPTQSDIMGLQS